jgi:hypothetical protein
VEWDRDSQDAFYVSDKQDRPLRPIPFHADAVSALPAYRWRGPVRSDALKRVGKKRGPARPKGSGTAKLDTATVRRELRAQIRKIPPALIREEVTGALKG